MPVCTDTGVCSRVGVLLSLVLFSPDLYKSPLVFLFPVTYVTLVVTHLDEYPFRKHCIEGQLENSRSLSKF